MPGRFRPLQPPALDATTSIPTRPRPFASGPTLSCTGYSPGTDSGAVVWYFGGNFPAPTSSIAKEDIDMAGEQNSPAGPDLALGVSLKDFKNDTLHGHVGDEEVLLARAGSEIFAIDAYCSDYHGPLDDGLVVGASVRCPWHHACFDLRTGEAARPPALSPLSVWKVEQEGGRIFVRQRLEQSPPKRVSANAPRRIVIVGSGAAGFA